MFIIGFRTRSLIGSPEKVKETARRLKCFKIHSMICLQDTPNMRGMIKLLENHLITTFSETPIAVKNLHPPKGGFKKFRSGTVELEAFKIWLTKMKWDVL